MKEGTENEAKTEKIGTVKTVEKEIGKLFHLVIQVGIENVSVQEADQGQTQSQVMKAKRILPELQNLRTSQRTTVSTKLELIENLRSLKTRSTNQFETKCSLAAWTTR